MKEVPLLWSQTSKLAVTYEPYACPADLTGSPVPTCAVMLRVFSASGVAIADATVHSENGAKDLLSDGYGRSLLYLTRGKAVQASLSAAGYLTARISVACPSNVDYDERIIRLEKAATR